MQNSRAVANHRAGVSWYTQSLLKRNKNLYEAPVMTAFGRRHIEALHNGRKIET